jgi:hypothetical protein
MTTQCPSRSGKWRCELPDGHTGYHGQPLRLRIAHYARAQLRPQENT